MCECYRVGGPFISEDPSCPVHGSEAMSRQKTSDERIEELTETVASLRQEITRLREEMRQEIAQLRKNSLQGCLRSPSMDDVHSINVGLLLDVDDYNSTTFHVGDWNSSPEQGWVIASWTMKSGFQFQQNQIFYVVFVPKGESPMQAILDDKNVQIDAHRVSPVVYRSKIAADIQVNMLRIARDLHEDLWGGGEDVERN